MSVQGSEKFVSRDLGVTPRTNQELAERYPLLDFHTVEDEQVADLDPLTYEVIRHRLWSIADDMGETLKRMSGSLVVTQANDMASAILDERGDIVAAGLYVTMHLGSMDLAVKWTLQHRAKNPGINPGDMFFCNDPWVGGNHSNDVMLFAPVFWEGKLFCWTSVSAHQVDLGGIDPGSISPRALDVFSETVPIPPTKFVEGGELRADIEDMYLRRSRMPQLVSLDLRAKFGAHNVARERITALLERYGPDMVKAVMKRAMLDAETRTRRKLLELPDGSWSGLVYQDSTRIGGREVARVALTMTKTGDHIVYDFSDSDDQVDGPVNCTFACLRGATMAATLTTLGAGIPWSPGGILRCFEIVSRPGSIVDCTHPAACGAGPAAAGWASINVVIETLSGMLGTHPEHKANVLCGQCGTWDVTVFAGADPRGNPFVAMIQDPLLGGQGARATRDGVDTGGVYQVPKGAVADIEVNEFNYPFLYLWRREETDSGGPGRFRGGVSGSVCVVPHSSDPQPLIVNCTGAGKAMPQAHGMSGGYPGCTEHDVIVRGSNARALLGSGTMPEDLESLGGSLEIIPGAFESIVMPEDAYYTQWQSGGGYGDPLRRDLELVQHDLDERKVSVRAAHDVYGVAIGADGVIDAAASEALRATIRDERVRA
jgi:N-methylhydantoinase B